MRTILLTLIFLSTGSLFSQVPLLSEQARIHVVTCGPGQSELYSAFGHSALRVVDPMKGIDYIYNYGVFDFNQPNFYLNFARGYLNYKLEKQNYTQFRDLYIYFNRSITEQELDISQGDKQKLFEFLEWNYLPENQFYWYDYFYDNCATRIKDAVITALGDKVIFDGSHITGSKTIRQLTDDLLTHQAWGDLGIDICLGLPMDITASPDMYMFLPEYIEKAFNNAYLIEDSVQRPLVLKTIHTYESKAEELPSQLFSPMRLFWSVAILLILITGLQYKKGKKWILIDILFFGILGILGLFLLLLWLATDHQAAANNLNLLWAMPLHLYGMLLLVRNNRNKKSYFKVSFYWYLFLLLVWFFLPQQLNSALFPIALIAMIRSLYIWKGSSDID